MPDETSLRPRPGETPEQTVERVVAAMRERQEDVDDVVRRLREFKVEGTTFFREQFIAHDTKPDGGRYGMYDEGDEFAPFFSEAFLYNLVGKDDARSILGIIRGLCDLAGVEFR